MLKTVAAKLSCRVLILTGLAALLGSLANTVLPNRIPWRQNWGEEVQVAAELEGIPLVTEKEMATIVAGRQGIIFDARSTADFEAGHLPTAISLPVTGLDEAFPNIQPLLQPETPIVVYCSGRSCDESLHLGQFLKQQGYRKVVLYADGFTGWEASKRPVEHGQ